MIKKNKWMILVITLLCLAEAITLWRLRLYQEQEVFLMYELLRSESVSAQHIGTLQQATNATISFIDFMQTHKKELEKERYVPYEVMVYKDKKHIDTKTEMLPDILDIDSQFTCYRKLLGCMYLCAGDVESAYRELFLVWDSLYKNKDAKKFSKTEFLAHVTNQMDAMYLVKPRWKEGNDVDTNVFRAVNDMFITNAVIVSDGKK